MFNTDHLGMMPLGWNDFTNFGMYAQMEKNIATHLPGVW